MPDNWQHFTQKGHRKEHLAKKIGVWPVCDFSVTLA
jgi:hypothetical protein